MNKIIAVMISLIMSFLVLGPSAMGGDDGSSKEEIPLIGLDREGLPIQSFIKKKDYREKMGDLLSQVQESTLPVLERRSFRHRWNLRTVVVGIGFSLEAGLTKVFTLGVLPRFKVVFSNSRDSVLP